MIIPNFSSNVRYRIKILACFLILLAAINDQGLAQVPAAPSNLVATVSAMSTNAHGYYLTWTDNSNNEEYFSIWASLTLSPGSAYVEVAQVPANATSAHFSLNAFTGGTEVYFYVFPAISGSPVTYGTISNNASVVVPTSVFMNPPTNLTHSFPSTNLLRLNWTDNSNQEAYTEVFAKDITAGNGTFFVIARSDFNLTSDDYFYFLQPGRTYEVKIQMVRFNGTYGSLPIGSGDSNIVTVVVPGVINNTPPIAPANLAVAAQPSGANRAYGISWDDRSTDEIGFEISEKLSSETTWRGLQIVTGDTPGMTEGVGVTYDRHFNNSGNVVLFAPNEVFDFRVRAVRGNGPFAIFSDFATVLSTTQGTLNAPSNVRLTAPSDNGLVQLFWSDNSTTEDGVEVEYRVGGTGAFVPQWALPRTNYARWQESGGLGPFPPSTLVEFRLRAYQGAVATRTFSGYSSAGSVTMPDMVAPTALAQGAVGAEGNLNLTWTDNSGNELGYAVEARRTLPVPAETEFSLLLYTAANATSTALTTAHLIPGYTYEFRVRAVNQVDQNSPLIFSASSNFITLTAPFTAPSNLQAGTPTETAVTLNWDDNSSIEHGYNVYSRPAGSSAAPTLVGKVGASIKTATMGLVPGTSVEFFVEAFVSLNPSGESASARTSGVTVTARDAMTSPIYLELYSNELMPPFTLTTSTGSAVTSRSISGLPSGLNFNASTGVLSGTPANAAPTTCAVQVVFANGWTHNNTLAIRILLPPVANAFPAQTLALGTPVSVPLADKFTDPDASSAVRVNTNLAANSGNMDFILFDAATPLHVANFLGYVNRGDYVNTIFHRSIAGFISQGGAFRADAIATSFTAVPTVASPTNEPGISNIRGTVALAKLPSGPSTGSNQFFVNLGNNGPNLDFQNGGFTAFARVVAPGMSVADQLASLPTGNYNVSVGGAANTFDDFPVNAASAPATMNNALAVKINSVTALPVLTYSVVSNSNSAAVTASIVSGGLSLTPVAAGTSSVVIRAADLEGRFVDQTVAVTVNNSLANWANTENIPLGQQGANDDPDRDGRTNLLEYALMTGPTSGDGNSQPTVSTITDGSDKKGTITFKVRKFAALTYTVQGSSTLTGWSTIWTTADGFAAPTIVSAVDNADHTLVTVKDTTPYSPNVQRFLQVVVTSP